MRAARAQHVVAQQARARYECQQHTRVAYCLITPLMMPTTTPLIFTTCYYVPCYADDAPPDAARCAFLKMLFCRLTVSSIFTPSSLRFPPSSTRRRFITPRRRRRHVLPPLRRLFASLSIAILPVFCLFLYLSSVFIAHV